MSGSEIKVLHLIAGELGGGAARGAYSLHRGLLANGIYSRVLSDSSTNLSDETVFSIAKNSSQKLARALRKKVDVAPTLLYPSRKKVIFITGL
jgi:hypothetical protein